MELWKTIGPKNQRYNVAMPEGWNDQELWDLFNGLNKGAALVTKLRERGILSTSTEFLRSKISSIYLHSLNTEEAVEQYHFNCPQVP